MKTEEMLEKIDSINTKAKELKTLSDIKKGIDYGYIDSNHFEFVEHYGPNPTRIGIPKKVQPTSH